MARGSLVRGNGWALPSAEATQVSRPETQEQAQPSQDGHSASPRGGRPDLKKERHVGADPKGPHLGNARTVPMIR